MRILVSPVFAIAAVFVVVVRHTCFDELSFRT